MIDAIELVEQPNDADQRAQLYCFQIVMSFVLGSRCRLKKTEKTSDLGYFLLESGGDAPTFGCQQ